MGKITRLIVSLMVCITMIGVSTISTSANTTEKENNEQNLYFDETKGIMCECGNSLKEHIDAFKEININSKGIICPCGGNTIAKRVFTGEWLYNQVSRVCQDGKRNGHDYRQQQLVINKYTCGSCGFIREVTGYNTRWICKGFNN